MRTNPRACIERQNWKRYSRFGLLVSVVLCALTAGEARARCGDHPGDLSALAAARAAVAAQCPCDAAPSHTQYTQCARQVVNLAIATGALPRSCSAQVKKCAMKSICGQPGAATCCRTSKRGKTTCSIKRSASKCVAPRGGSVCVGQFMSCCDACTTGGCALLPTLTPSATPIDTATPAPLSTQTPVSSATLTVPATMAPTATPSHLYARGECP